MNSFIFHGTYGNSNENWFPWLKKELEKIGCETIVPDFPSPENPELIEWLNEFQKFELKLSEETIFVAHSLGVAFALHLLEKFKIKKCFFVAGFLGSINNPEFDKLNKSFMNEFNWNKIKSNCEKFVVFCSDNDPFIPKEKAIELSEKLNAELNLIHGAGHFNEIAGFKEFPELLNKIKKVKEEQELVAKAVEIEMNEVKTGKIKTKSFEEIKKKFKE